jgi:hypothetical protein
VGEPAVTQCVQFAGGKKSTHLRPSIVKHLATDSGGDYGGSDEDGDFFDWEVPLRPWVKKSVHVQTIQSVKVTFPPGGDVTVINNLSVVKKQGEASKDAPGDSGRFVVKKRDEASKDARGDSGRFVVKKKMGMVSVAVQTDSKSWKHRIRKLERKRKRGGPGQ